MAAVESSNASTLATRLEDDWAEDIRDLAGSRLQGPQKLLEFIYFLCGNEEFQATNAVRISGELSLRLVLLSRGGNLTCAFLEFDSVKLERRSRTCDLVFYCGNAVVARFDGAHWNVENPIKQDESRVYGRTMNIKVSYPALVKCKR